MSTINSNEHDAKHGVRSGPEQPLAQEHRDKPGASSSQQGSQEKQRGDVKRAGASARTSEHDREFIVNPQTTSVGGSPRGEGLGAQVNITPARKSYVTVLGVGKWPLYLDLWE
jgi:hypothetical protein